MRVCVCVCVYVYRCMCIYPYISPQYVCICINVFVFALHMEDCSDMYHGVCTSCLFTVVINKVHMCSSPFNLTRMFLNSFVTCCLGLVILFHLLVNCLRVDWLDCLYVFRVCFDSASHQRCTVGLCLLCLRVALFSEGKKGFFSFFFKKNVLPTWRPDVRCDN